jgi:hypothetical protein
MHATADLVGSAALVAVTRTTCRMVILAGAVYNPLVEIVPTFGRRLHVTALLLLPSTVAVNC